jgi:hypothetical protein
MWDRLRALLIPIYLWSTIVFSMLLSLVWSLVSGKGGMYLFAHYPQANMFLCSVNSFRRAGGLHGWRVQAATRAEAALIFADAYMADDVEKFQFYD